MIHKEVIRKIANYILQNADNIIRTGLYDGKAGLSLSLFIASEYLQDEHMEDIAHDLLQEALIIRNSDINFENGLAGVGYSLLYLIENNYLEADFDEIYGIQYEAIIENIENIENDPLRLINSLQTVYFLCYAKRIKKDDERITKIIKMIIEGLELFLLVQFHDFYDIRCIFKKTDILNVYKRYLQLIDYLNYIDFSRILLDDYAALHKKRRIISSLEIGYYLSKITAKYNINEHESTINDNIFNSINNIYLDTLSLKERIDYSKILNCINYNGVSEYNILPKIESFLKVKDNLIQNLLTTVDEKSFLFGYGGGLGRLLIYYINNKTELL